MVLPSWFSKPVPRDDGAVFPAIPLYLSPYYDPARQYPRNGRVAHTPSPLRQAIGPSQAEEDSEQPKLVIRIPPLRSQIKDEVPNTCSFATQNKRRKSENPNGTDAALDVTACRLVRRRLAGSLPESDEEDRASAASWPLHTDSKCHLSASLLTELLDATANIASMPNGTSSDGCQKARADASFVPHVGGIEQFLEEATAWKAETAAILAHQ
ncbi:uncharacterized protein LAESUDRAFT_172238 [Laetiporus sulphureus 93-53]|uniref:Uncharacterized protein n=1 Tax=Laetiporus sulphureus 93-53 TaxID=1314785 RepID=A0A165HVG9_9APHY|nr:uncharacterized protein LAESUDRAFT_172238 [Laetiporus sulphureus 93-53]KZT12243.1 hypothetical protein LAESUDRAFT_172238 [Laetiporus sulphureus 93-53]